MAGQKRKREDAAAESPPPQTAVAEEPEEDMAFDTTKPRRDAPADVAVALHVYALMRANRPVALSVFVAENSVPWSVMVDGRSLLAYALETTTTDFEFLRRSGAIRRETLLATSRRRKGISATNAWCTSIDGPDEKCFVDALAAVEPLDCLQVLERDPYASNRPSFAERVLMNLSDAGDVDRDADFDSRIERVLKKLPLDAPVTNLGNVMDTAYAYRRGKTLAALAARLPAFDPWQARRLFADIGARLKWFNRGFCSEEYVKTIATTMLDWMGDYYVDLASLTQTRLSVPELVACVVSYLRG